MTFGNSILKLSLALALLGTLTACSSTGGVTSVDPCVEIPFVDAPEAACTNTVSHKSYLVNAADWKKMRPTMIMLRAADWTKIKTDWLKGCRMLIRDGDKCNVAVDSIDKAIKSLDAIVKTVTNK